MSQLMKKKFPSITSIDVGTDGNTSFLRAARNGQLEKVLEHLESNIDINTSNANGLNALHLASKDGHVEIVKELLKRGAVIDAATKKGNTALHIASLAGQEEVVKLLVSHGASVNVQSQNGFTPLYMAAQENHDNVVKYLLANGANQSLSTEDGFTPLAVAMQQGHDKVVTVLLENDTRGKVRLPALHIAAKKDDVKAAKLLLENEHNPDVTSKSGFTPLHIASHYGNQAIANLLVQKGADVNYAAKHNITPLHVAAKWGKTNMVTVLLEQGANIESKTRDGLTPLHCAARSGHEQVVDMLLEKGAPISSKTKNGLAPLHMAAQGDHVDAARILLYHRAPVDEVTVDYLTALHVAAHCGHVRVAKLLLDRQADANARALNGFTPLHIACKKNRIKVVELLLKHGASIGATTESGLTPLHVASFMGCMNIVIYLLQHDASPDVPTVRGETPLHLAARANQTDIIRILLRNGAQVDARAREQQTPLHIASRLGNVDIVMLLLQHGAKVDNTTKDMYTALHIAAKEGQDEVAAALIDHGASLNATTKKGFTPLHLAAKYGHLKVAKLLLQKEAPVDAQGKNGVTPLHVASHYDHQNVALLLLEKGASPYATAKNGHTPLHIAAKKNQMDIANTLLEYGAKPNAESKAGFTPLHLSAQEGHCDMTDLLIEHKADPNHRAKNGLSPLHLCAQEDKVPVAEILVKNGGEVDAATKNGYTPLHIACHYGQINMVRFLLSHGANVKTTTSLGYTPLHQAAQQGHTNIVNTLLENSAQPNAVTNNGQTPLHIAEKLGYITVIDTLKVVTQPSSPMSTSTISNDEKYRVVAPEAMHETFMSDSEEEGGEDTVLGDQTYRYLTADEMKSLGDDSLPIDVTRDERIDSNKMVTNAENMLPPRHIEDNISPEHVQQNYVEYIKKYTPDNVDIDKHPINIGFLVSFLVDARGGAMRGCRHSGVRVIVPPRCASSPTRITCRYVRPQRTPHPPPLMEGEALASRVLELGPVGAKFLGPVIIEVPHFAALRGKEREIVILRSDNGESWKEHTVDATEEVLNEVLHDSFEAEDLNQLEDVSSGRITRIVTQDFPQYFAVVSRIRQEVHAIGPEGGMVSSTVVPQVQAVFPQGALTKKIKVGLQAQPIDPELTAKLLGHGVAVSPVVTVEPRRRKFHKAITLSMPAPRAHSQGMINQYSGSAPTLRLLCSITGGTTRAQWEDVTGSTPLTFVNDCVSFTTTVSARFWLMDCRNVGDATKMATELYREAIHVPFMAKFVVFAKRVDPLEARLRVFCMTDDKEDKTLEHQEHFTEVAKSRDVEVLEGKPQYIEFAGNLVPITKSGEQLQFSFRAFRENRLPFSVRVKDQHAEAVSRCLFMREPKLPKGEPPQQPICILNIVLPDDIVVDTISLTDSDSVKKIENFDYYRPDPRLADMSNLLGEDWVPLASQLGLTTSEINVIKSEYPDSVAKQAQSMLRMWLSQSGNKAQTNTLESALRRIGREDIIPQCLNVEYPAHGIKEIGKQRLIKKISIEQNLYERDIMRDSESVESLKKAEDERKKESFDKYSAEEKVVEETSDEEEDFNKTVTERRHQIEERLSVDRTVPASSQRVEIVQEISSIKRQSLVENKIAEVEQKAAEVVNTVKTTTTSNELTTSPPIDKTTVDGERERRDSALLEGVTQRFENTKTMVTKIASTEDPKSPKVSKTPPPSPADFITKEQAAAIQEWDVSKKSASQEEAPSQDAEQQGLSTTTERLVASNEETLLDKPLGQQLTGLSVIDDYLVTDLKTVIEQTNAFIQSESLPEPYDALAEKYTRKEPINEKKVDDNKNNMNEKKKAKKGFFGSIKTFVERSFESDSESEKSPKKSKKPKKDKKKKAKDEQGLPPRKPKLPTPPLEPSDIDSIPFVEASVSDLPPSYKPPDIPIKEDQVLVTDLDIDLNIQEKERERTPKLPEVKEKPSKGKEREKTPKLTEVKEKSQERISKEKDKKKSKAQTVVVEEVTKTIEPFVIESEEFSIVVDPTKKESPKKSKETFTINIDESIEKKEKEIMERSPILSEEKIVKPLAALEQINVPVRPPRAKDHIYEDIEDPLKVTQDQIKEMTTNLIHNEINNGAWSDLTSVPQDDIQKEIVEKQDKEILKEKDADSKKKDEKKSGFFSLFKKRDSKKDDEVPTIEKIEKKPLSESVLKDMADSKKFISDEVENYHDVRPILAKTADEDSVTVTTSTKPEVEESKPEESKAQSDGFFGLFKKPKKDEKTVTEKKAKKDEKKPEEKKLAVILSEEVLRNILDSKRFLEGEIQNYDDARQHDKKEEKLLEAVTEPSVKKTVEDVKESKPKEVTEKKEKIIDLKAEELPKKLVEDVKEPSPKKIERRESSPKPSGIFGLFKKSKDIELAEEVVKEIKETDQFLVAEVEKYEDAKPTPDEKKVEEVEGTQATDAAESQSSGFFGFFKKSKKEEEVPPAKPQLSETTVKEMDETNQFLTDELQNYEDAQPIKKGETIAEKKMTESVEEPSSGFFGLFKKAKKEDEKIAPEKESEEVTVDTKDEKTVAVEDDKIKKVVEEVRESSPKPGFFGLFKKSKKDEEETIPTKPPLSDSVLKDMKETSQFLSCEVENYHDVKPAKFERIQEEVVNKTLKETVESSPKTSRGLFGIFKKTKKDQEETFEPKKTVLSDTVLKEMNDTRSFLNSEIENYHDVKPEKFELVKEENVNKEQEEPQELSPKSRGIFGIFKKSKRDSVEAKPVISEGVIKDMKDTDEFLSVEVENYHDVKTPQEQQIVKVAEEIVESSPKPSRGLFGIFKKSKKDDEEASGTKSILSESIDKEVIKDIVDEAEKTAECKPETTTSVEEEKTAKPVEERTESSPSRGLFGIFKKSKKEEDLVEPKLTISEEVAKDMADTNTFLNEEVQNYHDVKPEKVASIDEEKVVKTVEERTESSPSRGLFGIFKKSKKEDDLVQPKSALSEEVSKDMDDTSTFLLEEIQNYHDVKPEKVASIDEEKIVKNVEERTESSPSRSLFGIFKKSKKEEDLAEPKSALLVEVAKDTADTTALVEDVEKYHHVKPEKTVSLDEEKVVKTVEEKTESLPTRGIFSIFKKSKKEEESVEPKVALSEDVVKDMTDTDKFIAEEVQNYHDVKPAKHGLIEERVTKTEEEKTETSSSSLFGIFKKSKKEDEDTKQKISLSEQVVKEIDDTNKFLNDEVENYHDVKPDANIKETELVEEEKVPKSVEEKTESLTRGILGIFKKSKKEEEEGIDAKPIQKEVEKTQEFISSEVAKYEDAKPVVTAEEKVTLKESVEETETKTEVKVGFLAKFKKTKKKTSLPDTQLSEEVQKQMDDTKKFISLELENYEDGTIKSPDKDKKEEKTVTFEDTTSKMVMESHLPQVEIAHVVEVAVKEDAADLVKDTTEQVEKVEEVLSKEATQTQQAIEEELKLSKKDKQSKEKKGFFNRFGKKSKSQEASFDESRGRLSEESEGSPKKQKRRKSSSPFKFFEKMKKSEEEVKEVETEESQILTQTESVTKEEPKDDLMTIKFDKEPGINLSEEVLGSLEKKMEELKRKYSPEAQKQMNDCRDFLFIEVDNYEDAKPVIVTDIDTGISSDASKAVDDIIDTAAKVVEKSTTQATEIKTDVLEAVTKSETEDSKNGEGSKKKEKKGDRKSGGFFSKLGNLISGSVEETKSEVKEAKKSAEKRVEKVKETTQKTIEKTKDDIKDAKDKVTKEADEKIKEVETTTSQKVDEAKEGILSLKESLLEATSKVGKKIDDVKKDTGSKAEQIKDSTLKTIDDSKQKAELAIDKTKTDLLDARDQKMEEVKQKTEEAKGTTEKTVTAAVETGVSKVDEFQKEIEEKITDVRTQAATLLEEAEQETLKTSKETKESVEGMKKIQHEVTKSGEEKMKKINLKGEQVFDTTEKQVEQLKEDSEKAKVEVEDAAKKKIQDITATINTEIRKVEETTKQKIDEAIKVKDKIVADAQVKAGHTMVELAKADGDMKNAVGETTEEFEKTVSQKINGFEKSKEITEKAATKKLEDPSKSKETIKSTGETKLEELTTSTIQKIEDVKKVKEEFKVISEEKIKDLVKTSSTLVDEFEKTKEETKEAVVQKVEEANKDMKKIVDTKVDEISEMKKEVESTMLGKAEEIQKEASKKVEDLVKVKEDVSKSATQKVDEFAKVKVSTKDVLSQKTDEISAFKQNTTDQLYRTHENLAETAEPLKQKTTKTTEEISKLKESTKDTFSKKTDEISKKAVKKGEDISAAFSAADEAVNGFHKSTAQKLNKLDKTKEDVIADLTKLKESSSEKIGETAKSKESAIEDLIRIEKSLKDTSSQIASELSKGVSQKTDDFIRTREKAIDDIEKIKSSASSKIDNATKATTTKLEETVDQTTKETAAKMVELDNELSKLTSSLEQLAEPIAKQVETVKSYVTSPTMARRAESQRFTRDERPTVREVKSGQQDEDSDEEHYTVTEPEEVEEKKRKPLFHLESEDDDSFESPKPKDRRDSVKSNVLETLSENKLDNLLTDLETQLVKDLDRSVTEVKEKSESKLEKAELELETIKKDSQADVDQIEQKLRDLDKALDSLEQASDPKLEKKLHRVERKFERMASEVMEKDVTEASPTEVEARREHEFQKLVSQLSTEEVSDFQKEYSHLWDETTFSKSDEWDSKTPDSQADVQELPQGEEPSFAATSGSKESSLKVEGEESGASGHQGDRTSQQRSVADQHQLSEEMKQLLKELEKESKQ